VDKIVFVPAVEGCLIAWYRTGSLLEDDFMFFESRGLDSADNDYFEDEEDCDDD